MKKTLSLLLALTLMLSILVIHAAAAVPEENAVEPCGGFADCPGCGSSSRYTTSGTNTESKVTTCSNSGASHAHIRYYYYRMEKCLFA